MRRVPAAPRSASGSPRTTRFTLHRPENVDHERILGGLLEAVSEVSAEVPVVVPLHPRTAERVRRFGLERLLETPGIHVCRSPRLPRFPGPSCRCEGRAHRFRRYPRRGDGTRHPVRDAPGVHREAGHCRGGGTNVVVGTKRDAVLEARAALHGESVPGRSRSSGMGAQASASRPGSPRRSSSSKGRRPRMPERIRLLEPRSTRSRWTMRSSWWTKPSRRDAQLSTPP